MLIRSGVNVLTVAISLDVTIVSLFLSNSLSASSAAGKEPASGSFLHSGHFQKLFLVYGELLY